ncbi:SDR family oxidoreductase [Roseibium suaedae]|uniref:NAD(P)-dependent dehydrogenase, short-chain alcohol dehydrogenase family n=1 Tax=Roseibium suaedae TaxID=735517 RepID=A0A1M7HKU6_9HYPH|nr:SDR family oxidoreductase [Roseibium suaedae]SHM29161.1 NAD(P)-dependent dehydrogenase, short-chain alcohol dehydrogenase family [Roseibium suaedae]
MAATPPPVAIITGASSRIGRAIALDLAEAGWSLVLHAHRNGSKIRDLAAEVQTRGGRAVELSADLTDDSARQGFLGKALEAFGGADVLINNASIFEDDCAGDLDPAQFDAHMAIHAKAPLFLADGFASSLDDGQQGLVVNIIDQRVWKLTPQALTYTLSKATLWTATQVLAQALAPKIRVNAIGPGPSFKSPRQSETDFARQKDAVPLQRGPDPSEFGATIRYLWSAPSVTGQMIALDGGQHLAWQTPDVTDVGE